jgi:hypothetical protein
MRKHPENFPYIIYFNCPVHFCLVFETKFSKHTYCPGISINQNLTFCWIMEKTTAVGQVTPASGINHDAERAMELDQARNDRSDDKASISDADSAEFQGGVQRVRAITASWSTKTLVLMFIL